MSEALTVNIVLPETFVLFAGEVIEMLGAVVSDPFDVLRMRTITVAVEVLPLISKTFAWRKCFPLVRSVVFQLKSTEEFCELGVIVLELNKT